MADQRQTAAIRQLLESQRQGVLCTLSQKYAGWPFGSVAPYALTGTGDSLILVSGLAEHTRNLLADSRVSLFVQEAKGSANPQAEARVTVMARAVAVPEEEYEEAARRYLARFPDSAQSFQPGDFRLYRLETEHVRFIGGFGDMFWAHRSDLIA